MDERIDWGNDKEMYESGMILKSASMESHEISAKDLSLINKLTLSPVSEDEVFVFKVAMCDNEIDRTYEWFSSKALGDFKKLFVGKTVIKDHMRSADRQVARIYETELLQHDKITKNCESYTQLVAHCYMVKTASNADLIADIKAGIKKEASVGCSVTSAICSICGTDNTKSYCPHWPGRSYDKENGKQQCTFKLDGGKDAYELSLVAVPAQPKAGVCKSYAGKAVYEEPEKLKETKQQHEISSEFDLKAKELELFLYFKKNQEE